MREMDDDKKISFALTAEILLPAVKFCILRPIPGFFEFNRYANIILAIIMMIIIIPTLRVVYKRKFKTSIIILLALSIFILSNIILFEENIINITNHVFGIYSISYVCFILALTLEDYEVFLNYLSKACPVIILSGVFNVFAMTFVYNGAASYNQYDMSLSYYMLIPTVVMLLMYYRNNNIKSFIFFIMGLGIILARGSRGVLIGIATFFIIYNFKNTKLTNKKILISIIYVFILIPVIMNFDKIIIFMVEVLNKYGINSRTLEYMLNGNMMSASNRDIIAYGLINKIEKNPILGIGFLGDLTSHNIIIETILFYGVIAGLLLLLFLIMIIIKSLLYKKDNTLASIILVFFSYAIPDALLNLTIWGKDMFWIYMGLVIGGIYKLR